MVPSEATLEIAAHHEAGHIVIAATQGLRLRSEGLSIDPDGEGLACYYKEPEDSDSSRERVILSTFAGFKAEEYFRSERGHAERNPMEILLSCDWYEARANLQVLKRISIKQRY